MWNNASLAISVGVFAAVAAAQSGDGLPHKLSGRWTVVGPNQTFVNPVALEFDGDGKPGPITGRATWRGVTCGAQDEPLTGTWDGKELRVVTTHRANTNASRMNGQCGDGKTTYVLTRKPGEKTFEGEARSNYSSSVATISVSP